MRSTVERRLRINYDLKKFQVWKSLNKSLNAFGKTFSILGENKKGFKSFYLLYKFAVFNFTYLIEITIIIRYYSTANL
jgi:hypothetical protein